MPVYRYECSKCGLSFEKLVSKVSANAETSCVSCLAPSHKVVSRAAAVFNSSRPAGETGIHDVDYPVADKMVGRSAEKKWVQFQERRDVEDTARKEYGTEYLGKVAVNANTDEYYAVGPERLNLRREIAKEADKIMSSEQ
jgi:putative FmdB family regulatory protein